MGFFGSSIVFSILAVIAAFFVGGMPAVFIVLILGVLETSLSFDNAVVNATVLKKMDEKRQRRFLTRGMVIAVFGMRVIFPIIIVAIVGHIDLISTVKLALFDQNTYATILEGAKITIAGFGGAFLTMVALNFFLDVEKESHRIGPVEKFLKKIGQLKAMEIVLTLIILIVMSKFIHGAESMSFIIAGLRGLIVFMLVEGLTGLLENSKEALQSTAKVGLSLFLYLEVLDASFSFDGVIGAFALSKNIIIIALGLGIGAMFVRSLTIMLVKKGTLAKYRFLEHGAFWAILALAVIMFVGTVHEVPEVVTGLLGAGFIGVALISSILYNRKNNKLDN